MSRAVIVGIVFGVAAASTPFVAIASSLTLQAPHGGSYRLQVTSLKEARFKTTLPQQYDFSCGSAATATLLTFQYGYPVSEEDVFVQMYREGDQQTGFRIKAGTLAD